MTIQISWHVLTSRSGWFCLNLANICESFKNISYIIAQLTMTEFADYLPLSWICS